VVVIVVVVSMWIVSSSSRVALYGYHTALVAIRYISDRH
jgi:hypothetical protein